jgi:hypothetical protein
VTVAGAASAAVFVAALGLLVVDGRALGDSLGWLERVGLALLVTGGLGAGVHAAGFAPSSGSLRFVARPVYAWPAALSGALIYLFIDNLVRT